MGAFLRRTGGRRALIAALVAGAAALACSEEIAPQFVIQGTGTLDGLVFFDADRNLAYDPSAGDTVVVGATLLVRERGSAQTISGGQAVTDAAGRFRITGLPPGTHDLFVDTTTTPAGMAFCQNPRRVTIAINLSRFAEVTARGGCVIPIADAEANPVGTFVTVEGIVVAAPGQLRSAGDNAYIEDASGGIQLFGSALAGRGIAIGDRIEVSGDLMLFNTETEVINLQVNSIVVGAATPQPATVTTAEITAAGAPPTQNLLGRLLRIVKAQAAPFMSGGGRNAVFDDGTGATEVRIESGVLADTNAIDTQFPGGKCYDVVGVLGTFNGTAQLKPRTLADIQEVPCTP